MTTPEQLDRQTAEELFKAYRDYVRIGMTQVRTPEMDVEFSAAEKFLQANLLRFTGELLGCWFRVANEYEPLLMVFASLQRHANSINAQFNRPPTAVKQ